MANKMGPKLIALCSAAVGAIYVAGFAVTDSPEQAAGAQTASAMAQTQAVMGTSQAAKTRYKDGTYTGSGTNRIGTVEVAVTVQNDKIINVQITNCDTHYSQSRIDGLPEQVLERQSENVDVVSGATKSTQDFMTAVREALNQAEQANQG